MSYVLLFIIEEAVELFRHWQTVSQFPVTELSICAQSPTQTNNKQKLIARHDQSCI